MWEKASIFTDLQQFYCLWRSSSEAFCWDLFFSQHNDHFKDQVLTFLTYAPVVKMMHIFDIKIHKRCSNLDSFFSITHNEWKTPSHPATSPSIWPYDSFHHNAELSSLFALVLYMQCNTFSVVLCLGFLSNMLKLKHKIDAYWSTIISSVGFQSSKRLWD